MYQPPILDFSFIKRTISVQWFATDSYRQTDILLLLFKDIFVSLTAVKTFKIAFYNEEDKNFDDLFPV